MRIVPSIDLEKGRSRIVFWPGASTGVGAPTDQPARIARHFVDHGATLIHLVDFDGARGGAPTGKGNGMYRHGLYTQQAAALNSRLSDLQRESRALLRRLNP